MGYRLAVLCVLDCLLGAGRFRLCPALEGDSRVDAVIRLLRASGLAPCPREDAKLISRLRTRETSPIRIFFPPRRKGAEFTPRPNLGIFLAKTQRPQSSEITGEVIRKRFRRRAGVKSFFFMAAAINHCNYAGPMPPTGQMSRRLCRTPRPPWGYRYV